MIKIPEATAVALASVYERVRQKRKKTANNRFIQKEENQREKQKMSSIDNIQIVSMPNLEKIENFLNDQQYKDIIEKVETFNQRLCVERRLRIPFLDPQTNVAQNSCSLYMDKKKRLPGLNYGQIYSYPSKRWRKSKRQYLTKLQNIRPFANLRYTNQNSSSSTSNGGSTGGSVGSSSSSSGKDTNASLPTVAVSTAACTATTTSSNTSSTSSSLPSTGASLNDNSNSMSSLSNNGLSMETNNHLHSGSLSIGIGEESSSLGAPDTEDSKDSQQHMSSDLPRDWFYDELDMNEIDNLDDTEHGDSDYDYNINGYKRKRKRASKPVRKSRGSELQHPQYHLQHAYQQHYNNDGTPRKGRPPGSGSGTRRGRRKQNPPPGPSSTNNSNSRDYDDTLSSPIAEPPSFASAALNIEHANMNDNSNDLSYSTDLRNYRKYL